MNRPDSYEARHDPSEERVRLVIPSFQTRLELPGSGDVGFAILGDRQWKSGPQHVETGSGRADHVKDQTTAVFAAVGYTINGY